MTDILGPEIEAWENKIMSMTFCLMVTHGQGCGREPGLSCAPGSVNSLLEPLILKRLRPIAGKRNVELTFESIPAR